MKRISPENSPLAHVSFNLSPFLYVLLIKSNIMNILFDGKGVIENELQLPTHSSNHLQMS